MFNPRHLQRKVADAILVLSVSDDKPEALPTPANTVTTSITLAAPAPSSLPELARLPAKDIIALIDAPALSALGVSPAPTEIKLSTDSFMDELEGRPVHEVKQMLGNRLHKVIKGFGVKGGPGLVIKLLDSEDLRPLAHLIDFPDVLREKVFFLGAQLKTRA